MKKSLIGKAAGCSCACIQTQTHVDEAATTNRMAIVLSAAIAAVAYDFLTLIDNRN